MAQTSEHHREYHVAGHVPGVDAGQLASLRTSEDILPPEMTDDSRRNPAFQHLGMYRINPETGEPLFDITGQPLNAPDQIQRTRLALLRLADAVKVKKSGSAGAAGASPVGATEIDGDNPVPSIHRMNGKLAALYKAVCPVHGDYFCNKIVNGYEVWIPPGCPTCRADAIKQVEIKSGEFACELHVPTIFKDATLENYELYDDAQFPVASRLQRYVKTFPEQLANGRGLFFAGSGGTGKTHLSLAIAKEVVAKGYKAEYFEVDPLLKAAWAVDIKDRANWVSNLIMRSDLLILDELARQSVSTGSLNLFFDMVNRRTNECKPLIVISNRSSAELARIFGEELWSRIVRCNETIEMNWPNYRMLNPNAGGQGG